MASLDEITRALDRLKREILDRETELWACPPTSYIDYCDPEVAARAIAYEVRYEETLGQFGEGTNRFEVAGCVRPSEKLILVSRRFDVTSQRFTLAHEVAHAYLQHPGLERHRERPILAYSTTAKSPMEWEADKFAALFLVTPKLLRREFKAIWSNAPLEINEDVAFALDPNDPGPLLHTDDGARVRRATAIARFSGGFAFGGRIKSLAQRFNVSVEMMSYRLIEERLIKDWP